MSYHITVLSVSS